MIFKFFPLKKVVITEISVSSDDIFSWIREELPVSPTAPPKRIALSLPMGVIVCPNRAEGLSPLN